MTLCPNTNKACRCQPQDGVMCPFGPTPNDWKPWEPESMTTPTSDFVERAMELAAECESWWHIFCRAPDGSAAEAAAEARLEAARAALRAHLESALAQPVALGVPVAPKWRWREAVLASFAHEVCMGAIKPSELRPSAKVVLERVGLAALDDVVALLEKHPAPAPPSATLRLALEALEGEREMRLLGQSPDVHWESLRHIRRTNCARTDAAIAAIRHELGSSIAQELEGS